MQKEASLEEMENAFVALAMNPSDATLNELVCKESDEKLCIVCEDVARQVWIAL